MVTAKRKDWREQNVRYDFDEVVVMIRVGARLRSALLAVGLVAALAVAATVAVPALATNEYFECSSCTSVKCLSRKQLAFAACAYAEYWGHGNVKTLCRQ
jgi:hypothetical protein